MNIYVGNLSFQTEEAALRQAFEGYGEIASLAIITDRDTGRSRGFGFVEMPSKEEAEAAIAGLNGQDLDGKTLNLSEARPRNDNRGGRGGHRGGGGGGRRNNW